MASNSVEVTKGLVLAANILASKAREITSRGGPGGYPSEIPKAIKVGEPSVNNEVGTISIFTSNIGKERNADITVAFELGSGLTGPKGQRYPIAPVNASVLAFLWPEASNIVGRKGVPTTPLRDVNMNTGEFKGGKAFLPGVMHPGIKPRPFLQMALNESIFQMTRAMLQAVDVTILPDVPNLEVVK